MADETLEVLLYSYDSQTYVAVSNLNRAIPPSQLLPMNPMHFNRYGGFAADFFAKNGKIGNDINPALDMFTGVMATDANGRLKARGILKCEGDRVPRERIALEVQNTDFPKGAPLPYSAPVKAHAVGKAANRQCRSSAPTS